MHGGPPTRFRKQRGWPVTISRDLISSAGGGLLPFVVECLASSRLNGSPRFVRDIPGEHSPDDTSILVGERHGRDVRMPTLAKANKPTASRILLAPSFAKNRASDVDHHRAQIAIAAFANAEQSVSSAT